MSIIHDALKKAQQVRKSDKDRQEKMEAKKADPTAQKKKTVSRMQLLFTLRMASLLTVTALLLMMLFKHDNSKKTVITPLPARLAVKPHKKVQVTFQGALLSDRIKLALINRKSMHIGDEINGMKIIEIHQDTVDLQNRHGTIQLKAGETYSL